MPGAYKSLSLACLLALGGDSAFSRQLNPPFSPPSAAGVGGDSGDSGSTPPFLLLLSRAGRALWREKEREITRELRPRAGSVSPAATASRATALRHGAYGPTRARQALPAGTNLRVGPALCQARSTRKTAAKPSTCPAVVTCGHHPRPLPPATKRRLSTQGTWRVRRPGNRSPPAIKHGGAQTESLPARGPPFPRGD